MKKLFEKINAISNAHLNNTESALAEISPEIVKMAVKLNPAVLIDVMDIITLPSECFTDGKNRADLNNVSSKLAELVSSYTASSVNLHTAKTM